MTGSGNDFVFVDGRTAPAGLWAGSMIQAVCSRQAGVGADGFCIIEPGSARGAVRLHYFNRDGRRAELCGNASLCATRLAAWTELGDPDGLTLETDAGPIRARVVEGPGERAEITIGAVSGIAPAPVELEAGERSAHYVRVGVPHVVLEVADLSRIDLIPRGSALRSHPAFGSDGANVNFVAAGPDGWRMRTYERGVEAETLACGTGSVATATVLAATRGLALPIALRTPSGCLLEVVGTAADGGFSQVQLRGEGRLVFRAVLGG